MKSLTSNLIAAKNKLASGEPFIWLVKLDIYYNGSLQDTKRNAQTPGHVIEWDSQTWLPWPLRVALPGSKEAGEAGVGEVAWGNADRAFSALCKSYGGLVGSKVTLYLVNTEYLNAAGKLEFAYEILEMFESGDWARAAVGAPPGLEGFTFPGRRLLPDYCQWRYKEDGCYNGDQQPSGFANAGEDCDKTLTGAKGCVYHNNHKRFGSYPGIKSGYQK